MDIKGMLFDLDGTLANTLPLCIKVYKTAFERYTGRSFSDHEVTAHFGLSEAGIFQRVVPEHWEEGLQYYHELYEKWHDQCQAPFTGITDALHLLKERGVRMGVVTGKGMHTARYSLNYLGIAPYFSVIEAGQENTIAKAIAMRKILASWQMQPEYSAYIGDADTDIQEASAAGVLPLAANWAETATIDRLTTLQPFATFPTVTSFTDWIAHNVAVNNA